jgi:hypothetical protein
MLGAPKHRILEPSSEYNAAWEVHTPRRLHKASCRKLRTPAAGGRAGRSVGTVGSQSLLSMPFETRIP